METSLSNLKTECEEIQDFLELPTTDDTDELVARLAQINVYLARTGKMLADAKYALDKQTSNVFGQFSKTISSLPATVATKFIASQTQDENYMVNWIDRLNRTCTHVSENMRTQVSYGKEQLKLTRSGY